MDLIQQLAVGVTVWGRNFTLPKLDLTGKGYEFPIKYNLEEGNKFLSF